MRKSVAQAAGLCRRHQPYRIQTFVAIAGLLAAVIVAGRLPAAESSQNEDGFESIFDGENLDGWDGDPRLWKVRDGVIRGESTERYPVERHTYLTWRGGKIGDFELRLSFRIPSGNSGVQIRSEDRGDWFVTGYQVEVVPSAEGMGTFYEIGGRRGMNSIGEKVLYTKEGERRLIGTFGDPRVLRSLYKPGEWNDLTVIGKGARMTQALNGTVVSEIIDEDKDKRALSGCLAFQLHAGPPMVVEYKDIRLKRHDNGDAIVLFDGEDFEGWRVVSGGFYGNEGDVKVEDGVIKMGIGMPMTGIGWEGALPRDNYEVTLEGRRTDGYDFFCGMTFPVAESYVTLILGGWGGYVVGLSNVDNMNASENETAMGREFEMNEWYRVRVRVSEPKIQVWLDEEEIIDIEREGHEFNVWPEQEPIRPFGISTYDTASELRDIKIRKLGPEEIEERE